MDEKVALCLPLDLDAYLADVERDLILSALTQAKYKKTVAARLLGLRRTTLHMKMRRLEISPSPEKEDTCSL